MSFMKKFLTAMAVCFLLFGFSQAQASLVWVQDAMGNTKDYNQYNYQVIANGGNFLYDGNYFHTSSQTGSATSFAGTVKKVVPEFVNYPGSINMIGTAHGESYYEGLTVYGSAVIDQTNLTASHGVDIAQEISSVITRRFTIGETGLYNLKADLLGSINFSSFGVPYSNYWADYGVTGSVTLEALTGDELSGSVNNLGYVVEPISLSDTDMHELLEVELFPQIDGKDVTYQLKASLYLQTDVHNTMAFFYTSGDISGYGDWMLGDENNPLTLNATVTPVPIPGSLILLFSGLSGLLAFSRRRLAKGEWRGSC